MGAVVLTALMPNICRTLMMPTPRSSMKCRMTSGAVPIQRRNVGVSKTPTTVSTMPLSRPSITSV